MSEDDNFLSRWSRLKRQSDQERAKQPGGDETSKPGEAAAPADESMEGSAPAEPTIDLSSLPSLEEITASTDIRAFLQAGVPAELTKAALRRVWSADPAIRDFIGIAENQWDFTDPSSIPGFGPLQPSDNVPELVARAMGRLDEAIAAQTPSELPVEQQEQQPQATEVAHHEAASQAVDAKDRTDERDAKSVSVDAQQSQAPTALQYPNAPEEPPTSSSPRGHGRALPR